MIHAYKLFDKNIVIDVYSGSVHVVDDVAFDAIVMREKEDKAAVRDALLKKYPDLTSEDIGELFDDIDELEAQGRLYAKDIYENMAFDLKARHTEIKALCLHVAHTCNLNCEYCFAGQGKFHGERALMSFEVGKRAIDLSLIHI